MDNTDVRLNTSRPVAGMNSSHSATRHSYLNANRTRCVVCVETHC